MNRQNCVNCFLDIRLFLFYVDFFFGAATIEIRHLSVKKKKPEIEVLRARPLALTGLSVHRRGISVLLFRGLP